MVLGELMHLALTDEVDAAVTHVSDEPAHSSHQQQVHGGAHASFFRFGLGTVVDGRAGLLHRMFQDSRHVGLG